jgi:O-antigen ligase
MKMKKIISLEKAIYSLILFLPLYLIRLKVFSIPTNLWEVFAFLLFFWWASKRSGSYFNWKEESGRLLFLGLGLILAGFLVSTLSRANYLAGLGIIKSWFLVPVIFSLITLDVLGRGKRDLIFNALYFSAFGVAVLSLAYYFLGNITYDGRLQGIFNSPNYLAMYLSPAVLIGFWRLIDKKEGQVSRKVILISFLAILLALFFTFSYAAWISVVLVLVGGVILKEGRLGYVFVLALALLAILFVERNSTKMNDLLNFSERSSLSSRTMIWRSSLKMVENNWFLGIGPGNFQAYYLDYQKYYPPYLEWAVPHPHNIFLAFWLYGGILGIIGFLLLIYLFLGKVLSGMKIANSWQVISMAIVMYFFLHGLFDTTILKNDLAVVFWLAYLAVVL